MPSPVEVAIIGAGPYGLSLAAHLRAAKIPFRIFGKPMSTWRHHMPLGMSLKSEGFASNLSAPDRQSTLEAWCAAHRRPYAAQKVPIALTDFADYADWFAKTYVPDLEQINVINILKDETNYTLTLEDGSIARARWVVVAVGITWFKEMPQELADLPAEFVSHSFDHHRADAFRGRTVTILGAGASAVDTALTFHNAGAQVTVVARANRIRFHEAPDNAPPTILGQLQNPDTGIGPGWRSFFCANTPLLFHRLPEALRLEATRRHLGPAPGWFTKEAFTNNICAELGQRLVSAKVAGGRIALEFEDKTGKRRVTMADHVVAATGYRPDLKKLPFLGAALRERIDQVVGTPILSDTFESSLSGLCFIGLMAANSFGPLLRFMVGAEFAAPRLTAHLRRRIGASTATRAA